jgi:hypothetical protein
VPIRTQEPNAVALEAKANRHADNPVFQPQSPPVEVPNLSNLLGKLKDCRLGVWLYQLITPGLQDALLEKNSERVIYTLGPIVREGSPTDSVSVYHCRLRRVVPHMGWKIGL